MIPLQVGECEVTLLPIVNGLASEAEKIDRAFGGYEAYGAALGIEGIQAIKHRDTLEDTFDVSELDIAYAKHLERFGQVEMPSPAVCRLVDLCAENGLNVIPLDMNDAEFTEMYCATVKTFDFVKEHRLAKKGAKKNFDSSSPEDFALDWDAFVNGVKGYRDVSLNREKFIADQIKDVAKYRKSLLVVLEVERVRGVMSQLQNR